MESSRSVPTGTRGSAQPGGFLLLGLAVLAGVAAFFWFQHQVASTQRVLAERVPVSMQVTVLDTTGAALQSRLVVVFVEGIDAGRTDASGRLRGLFPKSLATLSDNFSLREGELLPLTYPPDEQVIAYAFPGDRATLPPDIVACRTLTLSRDGKEVGCLGLPPTVSPNIRWPMLVLIALIVFPLATKALRHVNPMPREWGVALKATGEYAAGAAVTAVVVVMFDDTGFFDRWALKLYETIGPAVDSVLAAFAVTVGILTVVTTVRGCLPPKQ